MENLALKFTDLRKDYNGHEVLKGLTLEIPRGQIIGYIGSNGAGKSTTIKSILGIVDDYSGSIEVFGENIRSRSDYKRNIGYVPEVADLYDALTPREYYHFLGKLYDIDDASIDKKATTMLEIFGVKEIYNSKISTLSKGMRQKVLIVSSLLHNPDILFLDEPLTGLDTNSVTIFKDLLTSLAERGKTIFYSSHIMEVVEKISDRIILLHKGTIFADGTFEELKNSSNLGSLEEFFTDMTDFKDHKERSNEILSVLEDK